MRNRIARLITIGLTTVSMTLTALSGAAPITLTAQATESGTNAAPNGGAEATRGGSAGGVQTERDYDKGAAANGRKVVYYEDKYGPKDNYPNKYKGAVISAPNYPAGKIPDTIKNNTSEYVISILDIRPGKATNDGTHFVITTDRASVSKPGDYPQKINLYEIKNGRVVAGPKTVERNTGVLGNIKCRYEGGVFKFDTQDLATHNAVSVWNGQYELRSNFDRFYLNGLFRTSSYYANYWNACYRVYSLDKSMLAGTAYDRTQNNTTDMLPTMAEQVTQYIGITDEGEEIILDTFVMRGLTGEKYTAPGPNAYKGWIYDSSKEPKSREGVFGRKYEIGEVIYDKIGDYVRRYEVLDDNMNVKIGLYRVMQSELYQNLPASKRIKSQFLDGNDAPDANGNRYYLVQEVTLPIGDYVEWYESDNDVKPPVTSLGPLELVLSNDQKSIIYYGPSTSSYSGRLLWGQVPFRDVYTGKWTYTGDSIGVFNPIQEAPTPIKYYYKLAPAEPVSPETPDVESKGAKTTIKKALELKNIAHSYIPSVPDVTFNYEVIYDLYGTVVYNDGTETYGKDKTPVGYLVQGIDAGGFPSIRVGVDKGVATDIYDNGPDSIYEDKKIKDSFGNETTVLDANGNPVRTLKKEALYARYTPVAYGKDINDTEFEIWRGPIGGIKLTNAETGEQSHKGTVRFHHDDIADGDKAAPNTGDGVEDNREDMMTKKLQVEVVENAFKAPGVYRYILREKGGDERAMTEWDHELEKGKASSAVLDDIEHNFDETKNKEGEIRYLDIYVQWKVDESGLEVKDMVLHNISGKLDYDSHGDFALGEESSQEATALADEGKKDAFTESTYTTYDLVVGKEIMGKGLTNYDLNNDGKEQGRVFEFKVTINAPAYTKVTVTRAADTSGIRWEEYIAKEDGTIDPITVRLKQSDFLLFSGIPAGATYVVEEIDNWTKDPKQPAMFESYYVTDMKDVVEAKENRDKEFKQGSMITNNGSMLEDQPRRNSYMMLLQGKCQAELNGQEFEYGGEEKLVDALIDVSGTSEKKTSLQTMQKKTETDSVANVFFLNLRRDNVVTGVAMSVAPYALMVAAAVIGVGGFLIVKKRRDADLDEE